MKCKRYQIHTYYTFKASCCVLHRLISREQALGRSNIRKLYMKGAGAGVVALLAKPVREEAEAASRQVRGQPGLQSRTPASETLHPTQPTKAPPLRRLKKGGEGGERRRARRGKGREAQAAGCGEREGTEKNFVARFTAPSLGSIY